MKRLLSILLVILMMLMVFVSCDSAKETETETSTQDAVATTAKKSTPSKSVGNGVKSQDEGWAFWSQF